MHMLTHAWPAVEYDADVYQSFRELQDLAQPPAQPSRADAVGAAGAVLRAAAATNSQDVLDLWGPATMLSLVEGRTFRFRVSPGTCGVAVHDANRREKTLERLARARAVTVDVSTAYVVNDVLVPVPEPSRIIVEWSAKSRSRMFTTIPGLDFSDWTLESAGTLCMVTLTLPGDWLVLAPTGKAWKRFIERLAMRWKRAGLSWIGLWKMEFQAREAPHQHMLMRVPALVRGEVFELWLSRTWADVVGADREACHRCGGHACGDEHGGVGCPVAECFCEIPDTEYARHLSAGTGVDYSGSKFSDPRRIAAYFLGHSSKHTDGKEYQHVVPAAWREGGAGPGRFWGAWGLKKGGVEVELTEGDFNAVNRVLRHIANARAFDMAVDGIRWGKGLPADLKALGTWPLKRSVAVQLLDVEARSTARARRRLRKVWSFGSAGGMSGGTVVVNDGVGLGYDVARYLAQTRGLREFTRSPVKTS